MHATLVILSETMREKSLAWAILPRHAPDKCWEIKCSRDGTTCVRAGDDEIDVPREGMDSATFHTDKVELAKMTGTL